MNIYLSFKQKSFLYLCLNKKYILCEPQKVLA